MNGNSWSHWIWSAARRVGCLLLIAGMSHQGLQAQETGSIRGTVHVPALVQVAPRMRAPHYRSGGAPAPSKPKAAEQPEVTNVVVYLEGKGLERPTPGEIPVLDQRNATFIPHILPIVKGMSVRIVNRDRTYHNVFSLSAVKKFNIGRRPTGEEVPVTFDKTGAVQVFCDIHSNMSAVILVLENGFFVQPKEDGTYDLSNVPPGTYTIKAWHERFSTPAQQVTVRPGATATVNFEFQ